MSAKKTLLPGKEVELIPKGYTIRCNAQLDEYPEMDFPIELGVFTGEQKDIMFDVLTKLTVSCGPQNRVEANRVAKELGTKWPINRDGVPAWLDGFAIIFHNGEGNKYIMITDKIET